MPENLKKDWPYVAPQDKPWGEKNLNRMKENLADSLAEKKHENIPDYENLVARINNLHQRGLIDDFWKDGYLEHLDKYSADKYKNLAQDTTDAMKKELDSIEAKASEKPEKI